VEALLIKDLFQYFEITNVEIADDSLIFSKMKHLKDKG